MSRKKDLNKKETKYIGVAIPLEDKESIDNIAMELGITNAQYIRRSIYEAVNNSVNQPVLSTSIVETVMYIQGHKNDIEPDVYNNLMKYLSNITKLI